MVVKLMLDWQREAFVSGKAKKSMDKKDMNGSYSSDWKGVACASGPSFLCIVIFWLTLFVRALEH